MELGRVILRKAQPSDAGFIRSCFLPVDGYDPAELLIDPSVSITVARRLTKRIGMVAVAFSDGGWKPGARPGTGLAEVLCLSVHHGARRRGLGSYLMDHAKEIAVNVGAKRLEANVAEGNATTLRILGRMGCEVQGVEPLTYPDGQRALRVGRRL